MWHRNPDNQLVEPGDRSFWLGLWKSDEFRSLLANPESGYMQALEQVIARPWWLITPTQDYERRHFSVWFGQSIVRRTYENPVIEDLYYWHDLLHGLTFADAVGMGAQQWSMAMRANEIAVSTETEVLIYWRCPQLRAKTFDHPIWHDHIVNGLSVSARQRLMAYRARNQRNPNDEENLHEHALFSCMPRQWPLPYDFCPTQDRPTRETLWQLRRAISLSPREDDHVEMELAKYEGQAEPFYHAWADHWQEVEQERAVFAGLCAAGRWRDAVARRASVWERVSNEDGVPYGALAADLA